MQKEVLVIKVSPPTVEVMRLENMTLRKSVLKMSEALQQAQNAAPKK